MSNSWEPYDDPYTIYRAASIVAFVSIYMLTPFIWGIYERLAFLMRMHLAGINFFGENNEPERWIKVPGLQPLECADYNRNSFGLMISTRSFRNYKGP